MWTTLCAVDSRYSPTKSNTLSCITVTVRVLQQLAASRAHESYVLLQYKHASHPGYDVIQGNKKVNWYAVTQFMKRNPSCVRVADSIFIAFNFSVNSGYIIAFLHHNYN